MIQPGPLMLGPSCGLGDTLEMKVPRDTGPTSPSL